MRILGTPRGVGVCSRWGLRMLVRYWKLIGALFGLFVVMAIVVDLAIGIPGGAGLYAASCLAGGAAAGLSCMWALARQSLASGRVCARLRVVAESSESHCIEVLRRVTHYVEGRDRYWAGHSRRVGELTEQIARQMHLDDKLCTELGVAGQLHDIGLLAVPESVISNYTKFGVDEFRSIKKHSEVSYELLDPLDALRREALLAIRYHHERMNGTGYPAGLAEDQIPIEARILAVADSYDAMTHDRPHRRAMEPMQAMSELRRCCPAGYDPQCVDALARALKLTAMEASPAGSTGVPQGLGA